MESDDVTDSGNDGHSFELVAVDNGGGVVRFGSLGTTEVKGWVNNLEGANVFVLVSLIGESSVNDNTIDVVGLSGGKGNLVEFGVLVSASGDSLNTLSGGRLFLSGSSTWHCTVIRVDLKKL